MPYFKVLIVELVTVKLLNVDVAQLLNYIHEQMEKDNTLQINMDTFFNFPSKQNSVKK